MSTRLAERARRAAQRQPDRLDRIALAILLIAVFVVAPMVIGAGVTPYLDGRPAPLNAAIRAEQVYISKARDALEAQAATHRALQSVRPVSRSAAFQGAARMQAEVERLDTLAADLQRIVPPGRFAGLHRRLAETLAAYQQLATEAWAYYGDLNETHIEKIQQALPAVGEARENIAALLSEMDFESAPPVMFTLANLAANPTPGPTPTIEGGYRFGQ